MAKIFINGKEVRLVKNIKFANIKQKSTLLEYEKEIEKENYSLENIYVSKSADVDDSEWEDIITDLLDENDLFARSGGFDILDSDKRSDEFASIENGSSLTKEQKQYFKSKCKRLCVEVNHNGNVIYVDAQGSDYAKCVGVK